MVPTLVFSHLGRVALGCVFLRLCWLWLNDAASPHQPVVSTKPSRGQRSQDPPPFAGLTQRPQCALGEREAASPHVSPPVPPAPLPPPHRRPRTVDTARHCCPHAGGDYRGWLGRGNLRANGHPKGKSIMARSFMGSRAPWSGLSACSRAWPRAEACAPPPGYSRWIPTPGWRGWWKPPSRCVPFPGIASVICLATKCNSTSCTPSSGPSKTARSGQTKPANAWSPRRIGCGRRWRPKASGCHRCGAADGIR